MYEIHCAGGAKPLYAVWMKQNSEKQHDRLRSAAAAINSQNQASIYRAYKEVCRLRREIESLAKATSAPDVDRRASRRR
jgi:hypothetical protein